MEGYTKKITLNNEKVFFDNVYPGMVFTYSEAFSPQELTKLAAAKNVNVEYCRPGTPEYKQHGCFTMKVI